MKLKAESSDEAVPEGDERETSHREGNQECLPRRSSRLNTPNTPVKNHGVEIIHWKRALHFKRLRPIHKRDYAIVSQRQMPSWEFPLIKLRVGSCYWRGQGDFHGALIRQGLYWELSQQYWKMPLQPTPARWRESQWRCSASGCAQLVASGHLLSWAVTSWRVRSC